MPPRLYSRHSSTTMLSTGQSGDRLFLTDRKKFPYTKFGNNILHVVKDGDSWHHLAATYYSGLSNMETFFSAAQLWWVIADFQPVPVHDPTIALTPGTTVVVPALDTVLGTILNPTERDRLGV